MTGTGINARRSGNANALAVLQAVTIILTPFRRKNRAISNENRRTASGDLLPYLSLIHI